MRIFRTGDEGPEIARHPATVHRARRRRSKARSSGVVRLDAPRPRRAVPAAPAPAGRRPRRSRHLGPARGGGLPAGRPDPLPHAPDVRGDDVRDLQRMLNALGFDAGRRTASTATRPDRASASSNATSGTSRTGSSARTRCRCSDGCDPSTPSPLVRSCASARNWTPPVDRSRGGSSRSTSRRAGLTRMHRSARRPPSSTSSGRSAPIHGSSEPTAMRPRPRTAPGSRTRSARPHRSPWSSPLATRRVGGGPSARTSGAARRTPPPD